MASTLFSPFTLAVIKMSTLLLERLGGFRPVPGCGARIFSSDHKMGARTRATAKLQVGVEKVSESLPPSVFCSRAEPPASTEAAVDDGGSSVSLPAVGKLSA